jgi:hypothetical protein
MENKGLNINEIIVIEQLPQLFYKLEKVGEYLDEELSSIKDIVVSEESKQEVKKVRTNINNILKQFEDKRKEVKAKCLEEYNLFEEKYEQEVKGKLTTASEELKVKIDLIEVKQVEEKTCNVFDFIEEHLKANHLENVINSTQVKDFAGLKINLSTSEKSLKENALAFIERVANEVKLIEMEETPSNLLYEYKQNGFDLTKAKLTLIERQKQIEELAKQRDVVQEVIVEEQKVEEIVETITAPKEVIEEDEMLECQFKVKGTLEQIKAIKNFLNELGVEYK